jgi:hypothetical protein
MRCADLPDARADAGVIADDFGPKKSCKSLISNETGKRRNHRQKSSFVVRTTYNLLI